MSKEEVIKQAYGEYWDIVKDILDSEYWLSSVNCYSVAEIRVFNHFFDSKIGEISHNKVRPKSLQGLENNNGWIKINSEDDLPKESLLFWVKLNSEGINEFFHNKTSDGITYNRFMPNSQFYIEEWMKYATHYQLAITPPKPLY